jgi:hypothetical protein
MNRIFHITILLLLTFYGRTQTEFHRAYGSNGFDYGNEVLELSDSSLMVVGSTGISENSSDVYLLKVDSAGNFLWSTNFGGYLQESGEDFLLAKDSTIWICGYTNSQGSGAYDGYIAQTDINGQVLWDTAIGGSNWDFLYGIAEMPDSSIVVCGETYSMGAGNNDVYVARLKNKTVLWEITLGSSLSDKGKDVIVDPFGKILILSDEENLGLENDAALTRLNADGTIIWSEKFGQGIDVEVERVLHQVNDRYVFVGTEFDPGNDLPNAWFVFIDTNGSFLSEKRYTPALGMYGKEIVKYPNNNLFVINESFSFGFEDGYTDFVGYKTSLNGSYISGFLAGSPLDEIVGGALISSNYCQVVAGTMHYEAQGGADVVIVKFDTSGTTPFLVESYYEDVLSLEQESLNFSFYPTIFSDYFSIESDQELSHLNVYNLEGKFVKQWNLAPFKNDIVVEDQIITGIYLAEIHWKNGMRKTVKICKN